MSERRRFPVPEQASGFFVTQDTIGGANVTTIGEVRTRTPDSLKSPNLARVLERHFDGLNNDPEYSSGNLDSEELIPVLKGYRKDNVSVADLRKATTSFAVQRGVPEEMADVMGATFAEQIFQAGEQHGIHLTQVHKVPKSVSLEANLSGRRARHLDHPGKS